MGLQGKLTKENMGFTMPADTPAYQKKPFYYKRVKSYSFVFETDPDAAAALIPPQLLLTDTATASLRLYDYTWSTIGPYKEAILSVEVIYKGETFSYLTHLNLDSNVIL